MRNITLFVSIFLLYSTGCVPSLHPLYIEQDLVYEPNLIGLWTYESGESVELSKLDVNKYQVVYSRPEGGAATFVGHLMKIDGSMFMDLFPKHPIQHLNPEMNSVYRSGFIPVHSFVHVVQIEPTLQVRMLNISWLHKITKEDPQAIRHEKIGSDIVLTASTSELQAFLLKHLKTKGAFEAMGDLKRKAEAAQSK